MRVGISITSSYPGADSGDAVRWVIERGQAAASASLDHLSLGDHHSVGPVGTYVQNVPMIGRIMADWPRDRPIGLLFLLPLWNPVLAAEQVGTLAAMSDAPFIVQTGIGQGRGQFAGMGVAHRERGPVTDDAIEVMTSLLAGDTIDSERFGLRSASINPRPSQPVEWWIGSGTGEVPLERAARVGDAWYVSPGVPLEQLAPAIDHYRRRCEAHATTPRVVARRDVFVGDDDGAATAIGEGQIASGYRGMPADTLIFGGVDRVSEQLSRLTAIGVDDVVARTLAVEQTLAIRSIELLGEVRLQL